MGYTWHMKTVLSTVLGACVLALPGCHSGYDVDVRNMTDQPVVASIITDGGSGAHLVTNARLGPGDRAGLYAQTDGRQPIWVEADFGHNTGFPAKLNLFPGRTVINVRSQGVGANGKPLIEELPHP